MEAADKLAAHRATSRVLTSVRETRPARPFGLRFAVSPPQAGEHSKTYYTVTETEATQISRDGVVETITDQNVKEKED
ncbi:MAG: hypothetical protein ACRDRL_14960 [Sciscionella sp.]